MSGDLTGLGDPGSPPHDPGDLQLVGEHHEVGLLADRDRAQAVGEAEHPGGGERGDLGRLAQGQADLLDGAPERDVHGQGAARDGAALGQPCDAVGDVDLHRAEPVDAVARRPRAIASVISAVRPGSRDVVGQADHRRVQRARRR